MENIRVALKDVNVHLLTTDLDNNISIINFKYEGKEVFIKFNDSNDVVKCREFIAANYKVAKSVNLSSVVVMMENERVKEVECIIEANYLRFRLTLDSHDEDYDDFIEEFKIQID